MVVGNGISSINSMSKGKWWYRPRKIINPINTLYIVRICWVSPFKWLFDLFWVVKQLEYHPQGTCTTIFPVSLGKNTRPPMENWCNHIQACLLASPTPKETTTKLAKYYGKNGLPNARWCLVSTHLKNMLVKLGHVPKDWGENVKNENHHLEQLLLGFAFHGMCFFQHFDLPKVFFCMVFCSMAQMPQKMLIHLFLQVTHWDTFLACCDELCRFTKHWSLPHVTSQPTPVHRSINVLRTKLGSCILHTPQTLT